MSRAKKILYFCLFLIIVFVIGGLGGVVMRDRIFPSLLAGYPSLSRTPIFKNLAGNVTVIEKTEQLVVREDDSVDAIVSQPATAVVNIIAAPHGVVAGVNAGTENQTGVLLTNDGVIVTYGNGIAPAGSAMEYTVLLYDGSVHKASLLAEDPLTDLVFFRIDASNLPAIAIANSDDSRPGKKLVAIGNSFEEYQNRFSIGVLSYRNKTFNLSGKSVSSSEKLEGVFEMDLANADEYVGGPAVNFRGEMVGIFGMIRIDNKDRVFLIPSNVVRESLRLANAGKIDRPSLGVYYLTLTKASAIASGMDRDRGALIYSPSGTTGLAVLSGSAAERAGLRVGDIVIAVGGKEINLDNPLSVAIGRLAKGERTDLLVIRGGREITVPVTLK